MLSYVAAEYDDVMKLLITAGWHEESEGSVEAPTGAYSMVHVTWPMLADMVKEFDLFGNAIFPPKPGWYFIKEDDAGFVYVSVGTETDVRLEFSRYEKAYERWNQEA